MCPADRVLVHFECWIVYSGLFEVVLNRVTGWSFRTSWGITKRRVKGEMARFELLLLSAEWGLVGINYL
ncbi:hypothetical protein SAMN06265348_1277 [Pedobacter westerhofensis]|uniref:Uncharacterized protein n=1 Tax=Pedobacter westerhofensis TaxID=425512 RepID=A0A521FUH5_9SPHI|nr:hypothetical protein SAMN06265348_1277 [Pedobacter westerhofensis]